MRIRKRRFSSRRICRDLDVLGRMRRVAQRIERAGDLRESYGFGVPADLDDGPPHVQPRFDHARPDLRQFLDQPHAGRAVHAFQVELDRLGAVGQVLVIEVAEDVVVELGVGPIGRSRRPGLALARHRGADRTAPVRSRE